MKASIILILVALLPYSNCNCQEFSFSMFFEDARNNRDTLIFGYDVSATNSTDVVFNEIDLKGKAFQEDLEVRSTNEYELANHEIPFLVKTQIQQKKCDEAEIPFISAILIKCKYYPLKIRWDKNLFITNCTNYSLLTDWNPGGWFDAVEGGEQGPFFLKDIDSINLAYVGNSDFYVNNETYSKDTVRLLYFTLSSKTNYDRILKVKNELINSISIFPNPTNDIIMISSLNKDELESVKIFDLYGKLKLFGKNDIIDVASLPEGYYIIQIQIKGSSNKLFDKFLKF